jgi:hypothetical protein
MRLALGKWLEVVKVRTSWRSFHNVSLSNIPETMFDNKWRKSRRQWARPYIFSQTLAILSATEDLSEEAALAQDECSKKLL